MVTFDQHANQRVSKVTPIRTTLGDKKKYKPLKVMIEILIQC